MTFKEYITIKNPIGSSVRVRNLVIRFRLDENSDLNGRSGLGKRSKSTISKLQSKYKERLKKWDYTLRVKLLPSGRKT